VHIFCDKARYYENKEVRNYLRESKLKLHFLPVYSPNLNSIERLWKWIKERVTHKAGMTKILVTFAKKFFDFYSQFLG